TKIILRTSSPVPPKVQPARSRRLIRRAESGPGRSAEMLPIDSPPGLRSRRMNWNGYESSARIAAKSNRRRLTVLGALTAAALFTAMETEAQVPRADQEIILVTGSTDGLGREVA